MFRCNFYMKSGNTFSVVVRSLTVIRDETTGKMIRLDFIEVGNMPSILGIDLDSIEAIIATEKMSDNDNEEKEN